MDYTGTLLLVSHDRVFLDNVVTQTLVAEGDGRWQEYAGGYSDWLLQRPQPAAAPVPVATADRGRRRPRARRAAAKKLSFKEQRELESLPATIDALEKEQEALLASMGSGNVEAMRAASTRAAEITELLESAFARWSELEERASH